MRPLTQLEEAADRVIANNDRDLSWKRYQVPRTYPALATHGNFRIEAFERVNDARRAWVIREGADRDPGGGEFHKLVESFPGELDENGRPKEDLLWMADTRAEILEHMPFFKVLQSSDYVKHKRVLINGLGLGMVANAAAMFDGVDRIDVVEFNRDVMTLVAPYIHEKVVVYHADAYDIEWPPGTRWDIIWHDIWPTISEDNLPGMTALKNKYRRKGTWQGFWQIDGCRSQDRFYKAMQNNTLPVEDAVAFLRGIAPWNMGY